MDSLNDTQSERDGRNVRIQRVGVRGLRYPVTVTRPDDTTFSSVAHATLTVDLDAAVRGTHMSRFVEQLHEFHQDVRPARIIALARRLKEKLHSQDARVILEMPWFIDKKAPVSGRPGLVDYQVTWDVSVSGNEAKLVTTVVVPVTTVCPCSKAISDRGAHNQRGAVTLEAESGDTLWPDDLIRIVEASASCELYSLLKRPDEKFVTERAYDNPVFVEDLVRNVAVRMRAAEGVKAFRVQAENFESIHSHNAFAVAEEGF